MRKPLSVAALVLATLLPAAASAQIFVGVRGGYAMPWGDFLASAPVEDVLKSEIPLQLDLGLKLGKALAVGAYASYGIAQPAAGWKDHCDVTAADCSAAALRIGAQVNLHAANTETAELWGGVALGYEELRFKDSTSSFTEWTYKGYAATLQGGLDFFVSQDVRVGPFAALTVGQFGRMATVTETEIANRELHGWLQVGLRGLFAN